MNHETNTDFLTLGTNDINTPSNDGTKYEPLEEGLYNAVCVGIVVKEMQNFDKTGVEDKIQFLFQIVSDDKTHYVRSRPLKKSLHEKAGLWKLLADWTRQKDAETLISKMGTGGKFDIRYFIGKPIQLTIKQKEYNGKEYPEVAGYMSPKKGQSTDVIVEGIPAYLVKDVKSQNLLTGFTIKEAKKDQSTTEKAPQPVAEKAPPASKEDGDFPF